MKVLMIIPAYNEEKNILNTINSIKKYSDNEFLMMDDSSRRNLELTENMRDGTSDYSLLECVNFSKSCLACEPIFFSI